MEALERAGAGSSPDRPAPRPIAWTPLGRSLLVHPPTPRPTTTTDDSSFLPSVRSAPVVVHLYLPAAVDPAGGEAALVARAEEARSVAAAVDAIAVVRRATLALPPDARSRLSPGLWERPFRLPLSVDGGVGTIARTPPRPLAVDASSASAAAGRPRPEPLPAAAAARLAAPASLSDAADGGLPWAPRWDPTGVRVTAPPLPLAPPVAIASALHGAALALAQLHGASGASAPLVLSNQSPYSPASRSSPSASAPLSHHGDVRPSRFIVCESGHVRLWGAGGGWPGLGLLLSGPLGSATLRPGEAEGVGGVASTPRTGPCRLRGDNPLARRAAGEERAVEGAGGWCGAVHGGFLSPWREVGGGAAVGTAALRAADVQGLCCSIVEVATSGRRPVPGSPLDPLARTELDTWLRSVVTGPGVDDDDGAAAATGIAPTDDPAVAAAKLLARVCAARTAEEVGSTAESVAASLAAVVDAACGMRGAAVELSSVLAADAAVADSGSNPAAASAAGAAGSCPDSDPDVRAAATLSRIPGLLRALGAGEEAARAAEQAAGALSASRDGGGNGRRKCRRVPVVVSSEELPQMYPADIARRRAAVSLALPLLAALVDSTSADDGSDMAAAAAAASLAAAAAEACQAGRDAVALPALCRLVGGAGYSRGVRAAAALGAARDSYRLGPGHSSPPHPLPPGALAALRPVSSAEDATPATARAWAAWGELVAAAAISVAADPDASSAPLALLTSLAAGAPCPAAERARSEAQVQLRKLGVESTVRRENSDDDNDDDEDDDETSATAVTVTPLSLLDTCVESAAVAMKVERAGAGAVDDDDNGNDGGVATPPRDWRPAGRPVGPRGTLRPPTAAGGRPVVAAAACPRHSLIAAVSCGGREPWLWSVRGTAIGFESAATGEGDPATPTGSALSLIGDSADLDDDAETLCFVGGGVGGSGVRVAAGFASGALRLWEPDRPEAGPVWSAAVEASSGSGSGSGGGRTALEAAAVVAVVGGGEGDSCAIHHSTLLYCLRAGGDVEVFDSRDPSPSSRPAWRARIRPRVGAAVGIIASEKGGGGGASWIAALTERGTVATWDLRHGPGPALTTTVDPNPGRRVGGTRTGETVPPQDWAASFALDTGGWTSMTRSRTPGSAPMVWVAGRGGRATLWPLDGVGGAVAAIHVGGLGPSDDDDDNGDHGRGGSGSCGGGGGRGPIPSSLPSCFEGSGGPGGPWLPRGRGVRAASSSSSAVGFESAVAPAPALLPLEGGAIAVLSAEGRLRIFCAPTRGEASRLLAAPLEGVVWGDAPHLPVLPPGAGLPTTTVSWSGPGGAATAAAAEAARSALIVEYSGTIGHDDTDDGSLFSVAVVAERVRVNPVACARLVALDASCPLAPAARPRHAVRRADATLPAGVPGGLAWVDGGNREGDETDGGLAPLLVSWGTDGAVRLWR